MDCAGRVLGQPGAEHLLELFQRCNKLDDARELVSQPSRPTRERNPERSPEHVRRDSMR